MSAYFGQLPINGMMYNGHECSAMYNGNVIWPTATGVAGIPWSASGTMSYYNSYGIFDGMLGAISGQSADALTALGIAYYGRTDRNGRSADGTPSYTKSALNSGFLHTGLWLHYSARLYGAYNSNTTIEFPTAFFTDRSGSAITCETDGTAYASNKACYMNPCTRIFTAACTITAKSGHIQGPLGPVGGGRIETGVLYGKLPNIYATLTSNGWYTNVSSTANWSASGVLIP